MDIGEINNQIKVLKDLIRVREGVLDQERKINIELLYSTSLRKRYTDAIEATVEAQRELLDREERLGDELKEYNRKLEAIEKAYNSQRKEIELLTKKQEELKKSGKEHSEEYKNIQKEVNKLQEALEKEVSTLKIYEEHIKDTEKKINDLSGSAKHLSSIFAEIRLLDEGDVKSAADIDEYIERRIDNTKKLLELQNRLGVISAEETKELTKQLEETETKIQLQGEFIKRRVSPRLAPYVEDITKKAMGTGSIYKAIGIRGLELRQEKFRAIGAALGPRTTFESRIKAVQSLKDINKEFSGLNTIMEKTGKGAIGATSMLKGLSAVISSLGKLGIIGVIIQAVMAVIKTVNELDKFVKEFNKTFAKIYGPTVLLNNVGKAMKNFTDSVFDLQRNLRYGLKSEEIMGLFQSLSEAGISLQGVVKRISGGYDEMIKKAAEVHLDFGIAMEEAGSMLGDQILNLRYSLDEAADSFKVLSYDAAKAGIQSQRFYESVYAAAESLSYYGKFLNIASNTLKDFQEKGAMGFKDAQKQAQQFVELFKSMDKNSRIAFMEMSGGIESYREDFRKLMEQSRKSIDNYSASIRKKEMELAEARKKEDKDTISRLEAEIEAEKGHMSTAQRTFAMASAAVGSNAQDMAMYLELLSDKVGKRFAEYLRTMSKSGMDVFKDTRALTEHMKAVLGVSEEFSMMMIGTIQTSREGIKVMANDMKKLLDVLPTEESRKKARKDILGIIESGIKDGKMDMKTIKEGLENYGAETGIDVRTIMGYLDKYPKAVQELMKKGYEGVVSNIEDIAIAELEPVEKIVTETDREQAKRLDDIVKNTHTMEEILGINKEYATYMLAGNDLTRNMATLMLSTEQKVGSILGEVIKIRKGEKGGKTAEEFMRSKKAETIEKLFAKEMLLKKQIKEAKTEKEAEQLKNKLAATEGYRYLEESGYEAYTPALIPQAEKLAQRIEAKKKETERNLASLLAEKEELEKKAMLGLGSNKDVKEIDNTIKRVLKEYKKETGDILPIKIEDIKPKKDFRAVTGGFALLSKGDIVVNANKLSKGIDSGVGGYTDVAIKDLLNSVKSTNVPVSNNIPVSINIGTINGDADELMKRLQPAIEQLFERMFFKKQRRV